MLKTFHIITFLSSTAAMAAKTTLQNTTIDQRNFRLIPIPPQIDASCGLCMKIEKNFEEIFYMLKENNILTENAYLCKKVNEELECTILTMPQRQ